MLHARNRYEMQVEEELERLAAQPCDLKLQALLAQTPDEGHDRTHALAIDEIDAGKIEHHILVRLCETINSGPEVAAKSCFEIATGNAFAKSLPHTTLYNNRHQLEQQSGIGVWSLD